MLNKEYSVFFSSIIANPSQVNATHAEKLEKLIEVYPQAGILRALLARASKNGKPADFELKLKTAATYTPDRTVLYYLVNKPEALSAVQKQQVVPYMLADSTAKTLPVETSSVILEEAEDEFTSFDEEKHLVVNEDMPAANETDSLITENTLSADQDTFDDINELVAATAGEEEENEINYFHDKDESAVSWPAIANEEALGDTEIDDEVFDEITGIEDIHFNKVNYFKPITEEEAIPGDDEGIFVESEELHPVELTEEEGGTKEDSVEEKPNKERRLNLDDEAEKLILGNIAASNYFLFDSKFGERMEAASPSNNKEVQKLHELKTTTEAESLNNEANSDVSKYHDDKMPFSFLWWLDKTRKEHDDNYQPYKPYKLPVNPGLNKIGIPGELQYQYYENIIHSTDIEGIVNDKQPAKFNPDSKEDVIIERFIQEDPQIKPPSTDKIDNENKARKSAEDQDVMVTETLARIYVDQMLYHKAISTYKKLMLKFPEKSSYFVAQIELLEKKTN